MVNQTPHLVKIIEEHSFASSQFFLTRPTMAQGVFCSRVLCNLDRSYLFIKVESVLGCIRDLVFVMLCVLALMLYLIHLLPAIATFAER